MAYVIGFLAVELGTIMYAWKFGGSPERAGALILALMLGVSFVGHSFGPLVFKAVDPIGVAVDLIGLIGFSWLGFSSRRVWPLWAGSLQLLSTGAHFVRALSIPVRPPVYYWMKTVPTMAVLLLLILGTLAHHRSLSRHR